jgi:hypothetical protein
MALAGPRIRGMSDYWIDPQTRVTGVILTQILHPIRVRARGVRHIA